LALFAEDAHVTLWHRAQALAVAPNLPY
jgi:hypothetical protein